MYVLCMYACVLPKKLVKTIVKWCQLSCTTAKCMNLYSYLLVEFIELSIAPVYVPLLLVNLNVDLVDMM